jgi:hypothetical protein
MNEDFGIVVCSLFMFTGIEPSTYSDGMISWFPIFFPLVV